MGSSTVVKKTPDTQEIPSSGTTRGFEAKAILFNDDYHTFDEVAVQLMKAIRCSHSRGMTLANVVHSTGSTVVYTGHLERCEAVVMVLEEIALKAAVQR